MSFSLIILIFIIINIFNNIHDFIYQKEENLLLTSSFKDYLYFSSNISNFAKRNHKYYNHFSKVKYERTYIPYNEAVIIITGKRNDINIKNIIIPLNTIDLNDTIIIKDGNKINKKLP